MVASNGFGLFNWVLAAARIDGDSAKHYASPEIQAEIAAAREKRIAR